MRRSPSAFSDNAAPCSNATIHHCKKNPTLINNAVAECKVALFEDGIPNTITNQKQSMLEIRRTSDPMAMTVRERFVAHTQCQSLCIVPMCVLPTL